MMKMALVFAGAFAAGCSSSSGSGPKAEVAETQIKLDLPAPPEFKMPEALADGSHTVNEMRLRSSKYLDQPVRVTGYIVSIYDAKKCAHELGAKLVQENQTLCAGKGEVSECMLKVGQKAVDETPERCQRPHFYLADSPGASIDRGVIVVDVPRALRKDEMKDQIIVEEFKKKPPPPDLPPMLEQQQKVLVTGKWAVKSPLGFTDSEGLLVYESIAPAI